MLCRPYKRSVFFSDTTNLGMLSHYSQWQDPGKNADLIFKTANRSVDVFCSEAFFWGFVWLLNWLSFFIVGESKSMLLYYPHNKSFHLPSYFWCLKTWTFSDSQIKSFSSLFVPFCVCVCATFLGSSNGQNRLASENEHVISMVPF